MLTRFKQLAVTAVAAAVVWGGSTASAAYPPANPDGNLYLEQISAPLGVGSTAKYNLVFGPNPISVSGFAFKVFYNSNQVVLSDADIPTANPDPNGSPFIAPVVNHVVNPPTVEGFNAYGIVMGDSFPAWGNRGPLAELSFTVQAGFAGSIDLGIKPYPEEDFDYDEDSYLLNWFLDGNGEPIVPHILPPTTTYGSPVITSLVPQGSWINNSSLVINIAGSNFYDGSGGTPLTSVAFDGTPVSVVSVAPTAISVSVPSSLLTTVGTHTITVTNTGPDTYVAATADFELVDRDHVYVDDNWVGTADGHIISPATPTLVFGANAFASIQDAVNAVDASGKIDVAAGNYSGLVSVPTAKSNIDIIGTGKPVLLAPVSAENSAIMTIAASGVNVDGLDFNVNRPDATVGIALQNTTPGADASDLTVQNCRFQASGSGGDADAYIGFPTKSMGIAIRNEGGSAFPQVTLTDNIIGLSLADGTTPAPFDRALYMRSGSGSIVNNDICGINHDAVIQFVHGAPMTIENNDFLGWGNDGFKGAQLDLTEPENSVTIVHNRFTPQADDGTYNHVRSLMIKNNSGISSADISITENIFNLRKVGILASNSVGQTIHDNEFNPVPGSSNFTAIQISNKVPTSGAVLARTNNAVITDNTFAAGTGTGIEFLNHNSAPAPVGGLFGTITVANNNFASGLTTYMNVDGRVGAAQGSGLPGYAGFGATTMAPFPTNIVADSNTYGGVLGSAATISQGFAIEDKISHGMDSSKDAATAVVRYNTSNVYVSQASASIKRGVAKADAGNTVNIEPGAVAYLDQNITIDKALTVDGFDASNPSDSGAVGNVLMNPITPVASNGAGTPAIGFIIAASNVTIRDMGIKGISTNQRFSSVITRPAVNSFDNTVLNNLSIANAGHFSNGRYAAVYLAQDWNAPKSSGTTVTDSDFTNCGYAGLHIVSGHNTVSSNTFNGMEYQGLFVTNNFGANAAPSPTILASGNTFTAAEVGAKVQTVATDSVISGNTFELGGFAGKVNLGMQVEWAPATVTGNTFKVVASTHEHIGLWIWDRDMDLNNASQVSGNHFENGGTKIGTAIELVGRRVGNLAGSGTDDSKHTKAVLQSNDITNYKTGIALRHAGAVVESGTDRVVQATINTNNQITNCDVAILVDGLNASANINGNTLSNNQKHFSFSTDGATVNGFDFSALVAGNLEAVTLANTVTGKTYLTTGMNAGGSLVAEAGYVNLRNTIQGSVNATASMNNTVYAMADSYREGVVVPKTLNLNGAGADVTTITGPYNVANAAVRLQFANNAKVQGFAVTRDGNDPANYYSNLQQIGIYVQDSSNCLIRNNVVHNTRSGVQLQNADNGIVTENVIRDNHTGIHGLHVGTNVQIISNHIYENRTNGILFREESSSDAPGLVVRNNSIHDNWLAQITARVSWTTVADVSGNWFGTPNVVAQIAENPLTDSYSSGILPSAYGGTYSKPGGALVITGIASNKVDYNAWLVTGVEKPGSNTSDLAFAGDFSTLNIAAASPLAGTQQSHVKDALLLLEDGALAGAARRINVTPGTYVDGPAVVDKQVIIAGTAPGAIFNPQSDIQVGFDIQESNVTLNNVTISGVNAATVYGNAIKRNGIYDNTVIDGVAVNLSGVDPTDARPGSSYAVDLRGSDSGSTIRNSNFTNCGYSAVAIWGPVTATLHNNTFDAMSYQGIFARANPVAPLGSPLVTITHNTFTNTPAGVRLVAAHPDSVIGGGEAGDVNSNTFSLGISTKPGLGVSVEENPAKVIGNTFSASNDLSSPTFGGGNIGVFVWRSATATEVADNSFAQASPGTNSRAIVLEGLRTGDLAGGSNNSIKTEADVHDNLINGFGKGIVVSNANNTNQLVVASINDNEMLNNAIHFAFSTGGTVNGFDMGARLPNDLSEVAFANDLTGKTYITEGMDVIAGQVQNETGYINLRNTITGSVDAAVTANAVQVLNGQYAELVNIPKMLRLTGRNHGLTDIRASSLSTDGKNSAVKLSANGIIVEKFGIFRDNTNANHWPTLYATAPGEALVLQGIHQQNVQNCVVQENRIEGFFSGVYFNQAQSNIAYRNELIGNRYGIQFANNCELNQIEQNKINANWIAGLLFNFDGGSVTNDVITVKNNDLSGNWRSQVDCHWQNSTEVLDLSGNWFGDVQVQAVQNNFEDVDDVHYGWGIPSGPALERIIGGRTGKALIDYNSWLNSGADTDSAMGFQGDFSTLNIAAASPLANGEGSHIHDAVALLEDGDLTGANRVINATAGTYVNANALVNKPVIIQGVSTDRSLATFRPSVALATGITIESDGVTIKDLSLTATGPSAMYGSAIKRSYTGVWNATTLQNIVVEYAGVSPNGFAVDLGQADSSVRSTGNTVRDSLFQNCGFAGLYVHGSEVNVHHNTFNRMSYTGIYTRPAGAARTLLNAYNNTFQNAHIGIRILASDAASVIGGSAALKNTFELGRNFADFVTPVNLPTVGVSVEDTACSVVGNDFKANNFNFGILNSIGVHAWDKTTLIKDNVFTLASGFTSTDATAIVVAGTRTSALAGTSGNDAHSNGIVQGNTITAYGTGILVGLAENGGASAAATINGSNIISNCTKGIQVDGTNVTAAISGNTINNNTTGISVVKGATTITNNSFGALTNPAKYIANTSANEIDVSNNSFASVTPAGLNAATTPAPFWTIQDFLTDALDNPAYGHLRMASGHVFVPVNKEGSVGGTGVISRGVKAAATSDQVNVQAGTYNQSALINKFVNVVSASGDHMAVLSGSDLGYAAKLDIPAGSNGLLLEGFTITGSAPTGVLVSGASQTDGSNWGVSYSRFTGMDDASTAIYVDRANNANNNAGVIEKNVITDSGAGIRINNSSNVAVFDTDIVANYGTAIGITKQDAGVLNSGITPENVSVHNCVITDNGTVDPDENNWNNSAYGVIMASYGGTEGVAAQKPFGRNNSVTSSTISNNGATGVFLSYQNSEGIGSTEVYGNVIESNGLYKSAEAYSNQNTDGLKINSSGNTIVTENHIRYNGRNNVLVSSRVADTANITAGTRINRNHMQKNVAFSNGIGGALMLQIYAPSSTPVDSVGNWWGHVYGPYNESVYGPFDPSSDSRQGGRVDAQSGTATVQPWYGYRTPALKWFALNDQDGDGIRDADEDITLGYDTQTTETRFNYVNAGNTGRDTDGDGYEDGVERALGTNPLSATDFPANPLANSQVDSDLDGYKDFYEIAQGTNPNDINSAPSLGKVDPTPSASGATHLTKMRRVLLGVKSFNDADIEQDNMDINRDSVISNADTIALRRVAESSVPAEKLLPQ